MPVTEEEREEFGEEGQGVGAPNFARRLIDAVRRRKGLAVDEKVQSTHFENIGSVLKIMSDDHQLSQAVQLCNLQP